MQKIEIILEGAEAEKCARLINDVIIAIMEQQHDVAVTRFYCGHAAMKKGFPEMQVPAFMMQTAAAKEKAPGQKKKKK